MESTTAAIISDTEEGHRVELDPQIEAALSMIRNTISKVPKADPVDEYFKENKITRPRDIPIVRGDMVTDADLERVDVIGESVSVLPQGEIRDQMLFLVLTINNLIFEKAAAVQEAEAWKSRADFLLCELLKHTVLLKQKW